MARATQATCGRDDASSVAGVALEQHAQCSSRGKIGARRTVAAGSTPFQGAAQGRAYTRHWTPLHLDFVVDDLDAALERALAAGAVLEAAPSQHAYGRLALLHDPFGHGFCLLQFEGKGYDQLLAAER